uniref:Kappa-theraphotoxin-Sc1a n=1 Tax=Stromatopelma calceatum TaxID=269628 RepID=TX1_STRCF|nr:RecName: Full=Kappa-theraphotoxin-Sc1a; Short=Kappa-TRTX-Sc1a; AltName: Full=Stromatoxin-1; Short=ScTx1 [Stromatopelma calceatum]
DCTRMFGACRRDSDCCPHLGCKPTSKYCAWDGTI